MKQYTVPSSTGQASPPSAATSHHSHSHSSLSFDKAITIPGANATTTSILIIADTIFIPLWFAAMYSGQFEIEYKETVMQGYYSTCLEEGLWKPNEDNPSECLECPEGGFCRE